MHSQELHHLGQEAGGNVEWWHFLTHTHTHTHTSLCLPWEETLTSSPDSQVMLLL